MISLSRPQGFALAAAVLAALVWSGIGPTDRLTWIMEVIWVVVGLPLLCSPGDAFR